MWSAAAVASTRSVRCGAYDAEALARSEQRQAAPDRPETPAGLPTYLICCAMIHTLVPVIDGQPLEFMTMIEHQLCRSAADVPVYAIRRRRHGECVSRRGAAAGDRAAVRERRIYPGQSAGNM